MLAIRFRRRGAEAACRLEPEPGLPFGQLRERPGATRRIGFGLDAAAGPRAHEQAGAAAAVALTDLREAALEAHGVGPSQAAWLAAGFALGSWRPPGAPGLTRLKRLTVLTDQPGAAEAAWAGIAPGVEGCLLARDLVSLPANQLTTRAFASRLEALAEVGIAVDVWGRKRLARAGLGALLAVGAGAGPASPPRLAILRWRGRIAAPPVAFVGKGLVFDTGGVCIKPARGMAAMRADMAGAAACVGAMLALARRQSAAPAVAVLALAENATGAASYRPGDVLRTGSGRTVEVVDTDAEGRLVLADALHQAIVGHAPRAVIDLATLTGAVVTALGHHRAGLFGNDSALMAAIAAAGEAVGEPVWPLPIGDAHRTDLRSDIADLRHCLPAAGRPLPDASHGAAFLEAFVGATPWAHLDIAGVDTQRAAHAGGPAGATGFGVRLLDRLVAQRFESEDHHPPPGASSLRAASA